MKKLIACVLAASMLLMLLAGCGNQNQNQNQNQNAPDGNTSNQQPAEDDAQQPADETEVVQPGGAFDEFARPQLVSADETFRLGAIAKDI